jgi:hypothetical protein
VGGGGEMYVIGVYPTGSKNIMYLVITSSHIKRKFVRCDCNWSAERMRATTDA